MDRRDDLIRARRRIERSIERLTVNSDVQRSQLVRMSVELKDIKESTKFNTNIMIGLSVLNITLLVMIVYYVYIIVKYLG